MLEVLDEYEILAILAVFWFNTTKRVDRSFANACYPVATFNFIRRSARYGSCFPLAPLPQNRCYGKETKRYNFYANHQAQVTARRH